MLTWLYNGTGGTILACAIWHGAYNDRGDEQRGGECAVALLQQRQREPSPAGLLAEAVDHGGEDGDADDPDRRQAMATEVAPARQLPDSSGGSQRNTPGTPAG